MDRLDQSIRGELARLGPGASMPEIVGAWPACVGPAVAANAWPARVDRDGTLRVHASSSVWAFELTQLAPTLLDRLRSAIGPDAPSGLRFAVGPIPEPAADAPPPRPAAPAPAAVAAAERIAAGVADDELRREVSRAIAWSLQIRRDDRSL